MITNQLQYCILDSASDFIISYTIYETALLWQSTALQEIQLIIHDWEIRTQKLHNSNTFP